MFKETPWTLEKSTKKKKLKVIFEPLNPDMSEYKTATDIARETQGGYTYTLQALKSLVREGKITTMDILCHGHQRTGYLFNSTTRPLIEKETDKIHELTCEYPVNKVHRETDKTQATEKRRYSINGKNSYTLSSLATAVGTYSQNKKFVEIFNKMLQEGEIKEVNSLNSYRIYKTNKGTLKKMKNELQGNMRSSEKKIYTTPRHSVFDKITPKNTEEVLKSTGAISKSLGYAAYSQSVREVLKELAQEKIIKEGTYLSDNKKQYTGYYVNYDKLKVISERLNQNQINKEKGKKTDSTGKKSEKKNWSFFIGLGNFKISFGINKGD